MYICTLSFGVVLAVVCKEKSDTNDRAAVATLATGEGREGGVDASQSYDKIHTDATV